eukprot:1716903-Rhodomonas_salina.3
MAAFNGTSYDSTLGPYSYLPVLCSFRSRGSLSALLAVSLHLSILRVSVCLCLSLGCRCRRAALDLLTAAPCMARTRWVASRSTSTTFAAGWSRCSASSSRTTGSSSRMPSSRPLAPNGRASSSSSGEAPSSLQAVSLVAVCVTALSAGGQVGLWRVRAPQRPGLVRARELPLGVGQGRRCSHRDHVTACDLGHSGHGHSDMLSQS